MSRNERFLVPDLLLQPPYVASNHKDWEEKHSIKYGTVTPEAWIVAHRTEPPYVAPVSQLQRDFNDQIVARGGLSASDIRRWMRANTGRFLSGSYGYHARLPRPLVMTITYDAAEPLRLEDALLPLDTTISSTRPLSQISRFPRELTQTPYQWVESTDSIVYSDRGCLYTEPFNSSQMRTLRSVLPNTRYSPTTELEAKLRALGTNAYGMGEHGKHLVYDTYVAHDAGYSPYSDPEHDPRLLLDPVIFYSVPTDFFVDIVDQPRPVDTILGSIDFAAIHFAQSLQSGATTDSILQGVYNGINDMITETFSGNESRIRNVYVTLRETYGFDAFYTADSLYDMLYRSSGYTEQVEVVRTYTQRLPGEKSQPGNPRVEFTAEPFDTRSRDNASKPFVSTWDFARLNELVQGQRPLAAQPRIEPQIPNVGKISSSTYADQRFFFQFLEEHHSVGQYLCHLLVSEPSLELVAQALLGRYVPLAIQHAYARTIADQVQDMTGYWGAKYVRTVAALGLLIADFRFAFSVLVNHMELAQYFNAPKTLYAYTLVKFNLEARRFADLTSVPVNQLGRERQRMVERMPSTLMKIYAALLEHTIEIERQRTDKLDFSPFLYAIRRDRSPTTGIMGAVVDWYSHIVWFKNICQIKERERETVLVQPRAPHTTDDLQTAISTPRRSGVRPQDSNANSRMFSYDVDDDDDDDIYTVTEAFKETSLW